MQPGRRILKTEQLQPGMVLRHHSGRVYTVVGMANDAHPSERFPETVVYRGANGNLWARPAIEFPGRFTVTFDGTNLAT